jgi:hypothetical protein
VLTQSVSSQGRAQVIQMGRQRHRQVMALAGSHHHGVNEQMIAEASNTTDMQGSYTRCPGEAWLGCSKLLGGCDDICMQAEGVTYVDANFCIAA